MNTAGAGSEAEGRTVAGTAYYLHGTAARQAQVRIRPQKYVVQHNAQVPVDAAFDTITDTAGTFAFSGVSAGHYLVEVIGQDSLAAIQHCTVTVSHDTPEGDTVELDTLRLDSMAYLCPVALPVKDTAVPLRFFIRGLERSSRGSGECFPIPPGVYELYIRGYYGTDDSIRIKRVSVAPGDTDSVMVAAYLGPCNGYCCDSSVVAALLRMNGITTQPVAQVSRHDGTRITHVDVSGMNIRRLPDALGALDAMRSLTIRNNRIDELPPYIGYCHRLDTLFIGPNALKALPSQIGRLHELQFISAGENALRTLPQEIGGLVQLRHLSLEDNDITFLPSSTGDLQALRKLYLAGNELSSLPGSITQLQSVSTLTIARNRLCDVPDSVAQWLTTRTTAWRAAQRCP
jgi:hypothetical protein